MIARIKQAFKNTGDTIRTWWNGPSLWEKPNRLRRGLFGPNLLDLEQDWLPVKSAIDAMGPDDTAPIEVMTAFLTQVDLSTSITAAEKLNLKQTLAKALVAKNQGDILSSLADMPRDVFTTYTVITIGITPVSIADNKTFARAIENNDTYAMAYFIKQGASVVGLDSNNMPRLVAQSAAPANSISKLMLGWMEASAKQTIDFDATNPVAVKAYADHRLSPSLKKFATAVYSRQPIEEVAEIFLKAYEDSDNKMGENALQHMQMVALNVLFGKMGDMTAEDLSAKLIRALDENKSLYKLFNAREKTVLGFFKQVTTTPLIDALREATSAGSLQACKDKITAAIKLPVSMPQAAGNGSVVNGLLSSYHRSMHEPASTGEGNSAKGSLDEPVVKKLADIVVRDEDHNRQTQQTARVVPPSSGWFGW